MKINEKQYQALLNERPRKFTAEQVDYRDADGDDRCCNCQHYFNRPADNWGVCEIFRSVETDKVGVKPGYTCNWMTWDGESFPNQDTSEDE